jgi:hypothetical protein
MLLGTLTYFLVTVSIGVVLGQYLGAGGVAWGNAAGALSAVLVNLAACQGAFGLPTGRLASRLLITAILAVLYGAGLSELIALLPQIGWLELLAVLVLGWSGFFVPAWFLLLPREDRVELRARVFGR